jgi:hypothetical protein
VFFSSRGKYVIAGFGKDGKNFNYLLVGFAWTENNLWEAAPDLTVMVEAGKVKVFKRQMTQFFNGRVNSYLAGFYLL